MSGLVYLFGHDWRLDGLLPRLRRGGAILTKARLRAFLTLPPIKVVPRVARNVWAARRGGALRRA